MALNNKEEVRILYKKPDYKYRDFELVEFEKLLLPYRTTKTDKWGEYTFYDFRRFLRENRGLTRDGAVIVSNLRKVVPKGSRADEYILDCSTTNYEVWSDKFEQLMYYQGRQKFALDKTLKQLDEVREQLDDNTSVPIILQ